MFYTNSNNYTIQQAGTDINTSIHDHLLRKSVLTQGANTYQPIRSRKARKGSNNWLINLVAHPTGKTKRSFTNVTQTAR